MHDVLALDQYPIHKPESAGYSTLIARCQTELSANGMFNLHGFLKPQIAADMAQAILPRIASEAFTHKRQHNIYFKKSIPELREDHPALQKFETVNHTLCADQLVDTRLSQIYSYPPLIQFLSDVMGLAALFEMDDPLARFNVMAYRPGEALNWHFDRSEFTTTLLLQSPESGGEFEYRSKLRSDGDPNFAGVASLLKGGDPEVRQLSLNAGTLNVFRGKNTAHRVTPVQGDKERLIAVFSYYQTPGVRFSDEENLGFYGRTG